MRKLTCFLVGFLLSTAAVSAECVLQSAKDVLENRRSGELVFIGTVVAITRTTDEGYKATFDVDRAWIGQVSKRFELHVWERLIERPHFDVGKRYVAIAQPIVDPETRQGVGLTSPDVVAFTPVQCSDPYSLQSTIMQDLLDGNWPSVKFGQPTFFTMPTVHDTETLPQAAARLGQQVQQTYMTEYPPNLSLADLAKDSDLLVRAVIANQRTRFTNDEMAIESDYTLQIRDVMFSRRQVKTGDTVIVTTFGGVMKINGHDVIGLDHDFPPLDLNAEYFLFLKFDPATGHYLVPDGAQGAFGVEGQPATENANGARRLVRQLSFKFGGKLFSDWNGHPPLFAFLEALEKEALKK